MQVSLAGTQVKGWQFGGSVAKMRIYADQDFETSDGEIIKAGSFDGIKFYREINLTVAGTVAAIPTITDFATTTDSPSVSSATYTAVFLDYRGRKVDFWLPYSFKVPHTKASPIAWTDIISFNNPPGPQPGVYGISWDQAALMVSQAAGNLNKANVGVLGRIETATTPLDLDHPKAVETADPRVGILATDYASLSAAVAAVGSAVANLIIGTASYPDGADVTVPATLRLIFTGAGSLTMTHNVTILSELDFTRGGFVTVGTGHYLTVSRIVNPDGHKIFYNIAADGSLGQVQNKNPSTIPFVIPQWWGAVADGVAVDYVPVKGMENYALGAALELGAFITIGVGSTTTVIQDPATTFTSAVLGRTLVFRYANDFIEYREVTAFTTHSVTLESALSFDWGGFICGYLALGQTYDCIAYTISATSGEHAYTHKERNIPIYFPAGTYSLGANVWLVRNAVGIKISGAGKDSTTVTSSAASAFRTDGLWSSRIGKDMTFQRTSSSAGWVMDIDGNVPGHPYTTRSVQQNILDNPKVVGASGTAAGTVGIIQCRQGGSGAQGENLIINPQILGNRFCFYNNGFNALANKILRGDFQDYVTGIFSVAGSVGGDTGSFESGHPYEQATDPDGWGFDIVVGLAGVSERMLFQGHRSESLQFFKGGPTQPATLQNCVQQFGSGFSSWSALGDYSLHACIIKRITVAGVGYDRLFVVTTAGTTGAVEPTWAITPGATYVDGSIVWTEIAFKSVDTLTLGGQSIEQIKIINCLFPPGTTNIGGWIEDYSATVSATFTLQLSVWAQPNVTHMLDASGAGFTYTLNNAPIGSTLRLKRIDSSANVITLAGGTATVDGAASLTIPSQGAIILVCSAANTWKVLAKNWGNDPMFLTTGAISTSFIAVSTTHYINPGTSTSNATESNRATPMPACIVRKLRINLVTTSPAAGTVVLTVRKNGVDTSITISIPAGTTTAVLSDSTHTASFADGDKLSISLTNNDAANTWLIANSVITLEAYRQ